MLKNAYPSSGSIVQLRIELLQVLLSATDSLMKLIVCYSEEAALPKDLVVLLMVNCSAILWAVLV